MNTRTGRVRIKHSVIGDSAAPAGSRAVGGTSPSVSAAAHGPVRTIAGLTSWTGNVNAFQRLFYFFILFSFLGYLGEVIVFPFYYGHFREWQGPLHGPWLPLYGFGGVALIVLLGQLRNRRIKLGRINIMPVLVFVLGFFTVSVVEFVGSWLLQTGFGITLWDYSTEPFNLQGRICLVNSLAFAVVGTALLWWFVPTIEHLLARLSARVNRILFSIVFGAFAADFVISISLVLLGVISIRTLN